ncbi:Uncharacterised protein [uncultured archaeon]|nr:Uncharacterised protein [uncultured archaeon]
MILDSQAFKPSFGPENVLGMIKKEMTKRSISKYDVTDLKLAYIPFYSFSFDILSEGNNASGKAAINAFSGELSDFVPLLFDKPLEKTKEVKEGIVENTSISQNEIKDAAATKIAVQSGAKKEIVNITAITKVYVPFYQVWISLPNDLLRIDFDACLGYPFGLETLPVPKKKNFSFGNLGDIFHTIIANKTYSIIALVVIIAILAFFVFSGSTETINCSLYQNYVRTQSNFFYSSQIVLPAIVNGTLHVEGECTLQTSKTGGNAVGFTVTLLQNGQQIPDSYHAFENLLKPNQDYVYKFELNWPVEQGFNGYQLNYLIN